MVEEAVEFMRENEPEEGYYLGFSGGKDSICTKRVAELAGVKFQAFYSAPGIDPPPVVQFIRQHHPDVTWLRPKETLFYALKRKAPPLRMQRWCCDELKKKPGKDIPLKHRLMGIRKEESARRAKRPRIDSFYGQTTYKPLFGWTEYHIWEFIEREGLPYPALYDEGFNRVGCVICPFIMGKSPGKTRQRQIVMRRWPGMWKAFRHACEIWFYDRMKEGIRTNQKHDTFDEYYEGYLKGFEDNQGRTIAEVLHPDQFVLEAV